MKTNKPVVPKAPQEVCDWKNAIYQDHKHLPVPEALREILRQAGQAAETFSLYSSPVEFPSASALAEQPPPYESGKK